MMYRVNFKDDSVVFTATEESKTPNFSSLYDLTISNLGAIEGFIVNGVEFLYDAEGYTENPANVSEIYIGIEPLKPEAIIFENNVRIPIQYI